MLLYNALVIFPSTLLILDRRIALLLLTTPNSAVEQAFIWQKIKSDEK